MLKQAPDAILIAQGRGRGVGMSLGGQSVAVAWERGAWCLVYRLEELIGAELLVDGEVRARAFRGEARRALEKVSSSAESVSLRLIFDDLRHPDFELNLWDLGDETRESALTAAAAVQEANRWIASVEALLRRTARRVAEPPTPPAPAPTSPSQPEPSLAPARPARPSPPSEREPDFFEDLIVPDDDN